MTMFRKCTPMLSSAKHYSALVTCDKKHLTIDTGLFAKGKQPRVRLIVTCQLSTVCSQWYTSKMRIIAIDPGYERLGVAVVEKNKKLFSAQGHGGPKEELLFSECFKTSASLPFVDRLELIGLEVKRIIEEFRPEALAIENLFIETNQKTAMRVSEVRGAILYQARILGLEIYEYTPLQVKVATTGYGKATKNQVISMVKKLISGAQSIKQDDEMDAIAIGLTHFAYIRPKNIHIK